MNRDSLLIGLSAAALLLAWWPRPAELIPVTVKRAQLSQHFAVPIDDLRLAELRKLTRPKPIGVDPELAMARWQYEVSAFYANSTAASPEQREIFHSVGHTRGKPDAALQQHAVEYWRERAASAKSELDAIESRLALRDQPKRVVIEFGAPFAARLPGVVFAMAAGLALLIATGFRLWERLTPPIHLTSDPASSVPASEATDSLRVVVPASWVKIRQPVSVILRRVAAASIVIAAVLSVIV